MTPRKPDVAVRLLWAVLIAQILMLGVLCVPWACERLRGKNGTEKAKQQEPESKTLDESLQKLQDWRDRQRLCPSGR